MSEPVAGPVFYDPQRHRWRWVKRLGLIIAITTSILFAFFVRSVTSSPVLPSLSPAGSPSPQPAESLSLVTAVPARTATPTATPTVAPAATTQVSSGTALLATRPPAVLTPVSAVQGTKAAAKTGTGKQTGATKAAASSQKKAAAGTKQTKTPDATAAEPTAAAATAAATLAPTVAATVAPAEPSVYAPGPRAHSQVIGFYVNWDEASFASLQANAAGLDKLMPEWLHLADARGTIADDDVDAETQVINYIGQNRPGLPIVPLVNNYNSEAQRWDGDRAARMLTSPSARAHATQALLDFVQANGLAGINVDFENLPPESQPHLLAFMTELHDRFHFLGLEVSLSVPLTDPAFDCARLAKAVDFIVLMAYDEHWSAGSPGPLASQDWFRQGLRARLLQAPASKFVVALGNYGYDWEATASSAATLKTWDAWGLARSAGAQAALDPAALNPHFAYEDGNGRHHEVWYLDAVTLFNQLAEAQQYGPLGFALWRLGSEEASVWPVLAQRDHLDRALAATLRTIPGSSDLDYEGSGEIMRVEATPQPGSRALTWDALAGRITRERVLSYPTAYLIQRWGGSDPKKLALTFDDGPDAQYTPLILDILHRYQVPATFFVVGANAHNQPGLLRRIQADGHVVANHTFSHVDAANTADAQLIVELNATQRLLDSELGRRSLLFRPPYSQNIIGEGRSQLRPMLITGRLGYYTVDAQIDPGDWQYSLADPIVDAVIQQATSGIGNVILLHDGGGNRAATVAALPRIIEELQARGYRFVTVNGLLGLSREQVMPPVPPADEPLVTLAGIDFLLARTGSRFLSIAFIVVIVLGVARLLFVAVLAVPQYRRARRARYSAGYRPGVCVIVPAYNEAKVIVRTVQALLASTYTNLEVLVVDDGSIDGTFGVVRANFGADPRVRLFRKPNGGKASALDYGISRTDRHILVTQDADTIVHPKAIARLVRHFVDPAIGAVAGNAKVGNRVNLLTRWQALEYITSQNLDRRAFALLNCIGVVPGAIGAWRRTTVVEAGGFKGDTLAEDADLTLAILRRGYRIAYEDQAIALTEAPETARALRRQRFRWVYGTYQAAWKSRDTAFRRRFHALGLITLPNIIVYQVFCPILAPLMDLATLYTLFNLIWRQLQHPGSYVGTDAVRMLAFYLAFLVLDYLSSVLAFALERDEDWSLLIWLFFQRFYYRQLIYYIACKSIFTAIRGTITGWGKLDRTATVQATFERIKAG